MVTYLVIVLGKFFPAMLMIGPDHVWVVALFVFGFTFVVPGINLLIIRYLSPGRRDESDESQPGGADEPKMKWLQMPTRRERIVPFIFISLMYSFVAFVFFYKLPFSSSFNKLMAVSAALVVVATVITLFYKVSVHSLGWGGFLGIILPLITFSPSLLFPAATAVVIAGLVISSRLLLNVHTPRETFIGVLAGLITGYGGMILLF